MPASASTRTRCPFVSCKQTNVRQVAPYIFRCDHCRRLSMQCENSRCGYLNRPFGKFCRRCHDDITVSNWEGGSGEEIWATAARFGTQRLGPTVGEAETVADLAALRDFHDPRAMLAVRFVHGLVAIHQAGGFIGLVHPFRGTAAEGEAAEAPVWASAEIIKCRPDVRPFDPVLGDDLKHLLFSTPAGVHAVHLWSLPGWVYEGEPWFTAVVDASAAGSPKLVAPPVILSAERFGLVGRDEQNRYRWGTFDLSGGQIFAADSQELPVEGAPCQVTRVGRELIAFATPLGHWVWRVADALGSNTGAVVRTWPQEHASGRLLLDMEWHTPQHFHLARQVLNYSRPEHGQAGRLEWLFAVGTNHAHELYQYAVDTQTLQPTRARNLELTSEKGALPIGVHADSVGSVALVRSQRLLRCVTATIQDWPGAAAVNVVEEFSGLIFHDPLMIILGSRELEGRAEERRRVTVRSLHHPSEWVAFPLGSILADPIVWARWLFTIERDDQRLLLCRRALGAADPGRSAEQQGGVQASTGQTNAGQQGAAT
jgi:hypothetical protein